MDKILTLQLEHVKDEVVRVEKKVDDSIGRIEKRLDESVNWHKALLVGVILTLIGVIFNLLKVIL